MPSITPYFERVRSDLFALDTVPQSGVGSRPRAIRRRLCVPAGGRWHPALCWRYGDDVTRPVLWAPGLIGEIADWIDTCAVHQARTLSVAAAVSTVATLAGRRYSLPSGARTILYSVGIARTGVGKEVGRQCAIGLLGAAGCADRIGTDDVTSAAAVVALLRGCPARLMLLDELGRLLESYGSAGAASHERGIVTSFVRLWSAGAGRYLGRAYAERDVQAVTCPHTVIYGTTTPESLIRSLKGSDIVDGVLSRLLLWRVDHGQLPPCRPTSSPMRPPPELVAKCKALAVGGQGGWTELGADSMPAPIIVPLTDEAEEAAVRIGERVRQRLDGPCPDLWVRVREQSLRLALAVAVSCGSDRVQVDHLAWAYQVVRWSTEGAQDLVQRHLAESDEQRAVLAIYGLLEGGAPVSKSVITRELQRVDRRVREAAIASALESGRVVCEARVVRGKASPTFRLVGDDELAITDGADPH